MASTVVNDFVAEWNIENDANPPPDPAVVVQRVNSDDVALIEELHELGNELDNQLPYGEDIYVQADNGTVVRVDLSVDGPLALHGLPVAADGGIRLVTTVSGPGSNAHMFYDAEKKLYCIKQDKAIALKFVNPTPQPDDILHISVEHCDAGMKHEAITVCSEHNKLGNTCAPAVFRVLNAPVNVRLFDNHARIAVPVPADLNSLDLLFLCNGSETHNKGLRMQSRRWKLKVIGTLSGHDVNREFDIQVKVKAMATKRLASTSGQPEARRARIEAPVGGGERERRAMLMVRLDAATADNKQLQIFTNNLLEGLVNTVECVNRLPTA
jgi:hypothetical protein